MDDGRIKARLRVAYGWTCDNCGRDNYVEGMAVDMPKSEQEAQLRHMGMLEPYEELPDDVGGEFVMIPDWVTCTHCKGSYETEEA